MSKIEDTLWAEYGTVSDLIKVLEDQDNRKVNVMEERDKIRNDLLKLELSRNELLIKRAEIRAEDEREKARNKINVAMFAISTSLSLYAIIKTFRFDQDGTITSTLGRNILNGVIPKMFKR